MGVYAHSMLQVFGVDEQEPVCVSRLAGADQRQKITPQWSGTGDERKHGHLEREVQALNTPVSICCATVQSSPLFYHPYCVSCCRFFLRNWWSVVLDGSPSGLLWQQVTLGLTPKDREGRVTSWSQRTEVHKDL